MENEHHPEKTESINMSSKTAKPVPEIIHKEPVVELKEPIRSTSDSASLSSLKLPIIIVVIGVVVVSIIAFGFSWLNSGSTFDSGKSEVKNDEFKELTKPIVTPSSTPTPSSSPTPTTEPSGILDSNSSQSGNQEIKLSKPTTKTVDGNVEYTYPVKVGSMAITNNKNGLNIKIKTTTCTSSSIFASTNNFDDTLTNLKEENDYVVKIKSYAISKELDVGSYEISNFKGVILSSGSIEAPKCHIADENNKYGKFSIPTPEIETDLVDGAIHFEWTYKIDDKAHEELEKGYKLQMEAPWCKKAIFQGDEDKYDELFNYSAPEGKMSSPGLAVNIDKDNLSSDKSKWLKTSKYKISDKSGNKLWEGFVEVPNCEE